MIKLKWNRLLILPLMILLLGVWLLWPHSKPAAEWFNESWQFRKKITVTNNTSAETNKYVTLTSFDTTDNVRFQTDCGDVRFVKANGEILPYYVVSGCDTSNTTFHINFDILPAGAQDIYIYYGNPTVTNGVEGADFASAATNVTVGSPATEETSPGPISYWKFDESADNTCAGGTNDACDTTSQKNDLALSGAAWKTEDLCAAGTCLLFDGSNDSVSKTYSSDGEFDPGTGSFTVSTWFKHISTIAGTDVLISRVDGSDENGIGYKVYMNSSGYICFGIDQTAGAFPLDFACSTSTEGSYADSSWHHVSAVKNGTTSLILYIDGKEIATDTSITSSTISGSSPVFRIGLDNGAVNPWDGFIDEVKYYGYARSADQIKTDAVRPAGQADRGNSAALGKESNKYLNEGLVGYWKMDETAADSCTSGKDSCDSSGNRNDGTWVNQVTPAVGKYYKSTTFDGSGDYTNAGDINL